MAAGDLVLEFVGAVFRRGSARGNENLRELAEPPFCFLWVYSTLSTVLLSRLAVGHLGLYHVALRL